LLPRPPRSPLFPYTTLFRSPVKPTPTDIVETQVVPFGGQVVLSCSNQLRPPVTYRWRKYVSLDYTVEEHLPADAVTLPDGSLLLDRKSTRLNSSHVKISYAV